MSNDLKNLGNGLAPAAEAPSSVASSGLPGHGSRLGGSRSYRACPRPSVALSRFEYRHQHPFCPSVRGKQCEGAHRGWERPEPHDTCAKRPTAVLRLVSSWAQTTLKTEGLMHNPHICSAGSSSFVRSMRRSSRFQFSLHLKQALEQSTRDADDPPPNTEAGHSKLEDNESHEDTSGDE